MDRYNEATIRREDAKEPYRSTTINFSISLFFCPARPQKLSTDSQRHYYWSILIGSPLLSRITRLLRCSKSKVAIPDSPISANVSLFSSDFWRRRVKYHDRWSHSEVKKFSKANRNKRAKREKCNLPFRDWPCLETKEPAIANVIGEKEHCYFMVQQVPLFHADIFEIVPFSPFLSLFHSQDRKVNHWRDASIALPFFYFSRLASRNRSLLLRHIWPSVENNKRGRGFLIWSFVVQLSQNSIRMV